MKTGQVVVHKQTLAVSDDDQVVSGRVVHVERTGPQELTVWFERDPAGRPWTYRTYGTGHPIPQGARHVASVIDGWFVWHLYLLAPTSDARLAELQDKP